MKKFHIICLTAGLTFIGLALFLYKVFVLHFPLLPNETEPRWIVEAHLTFNAQNTKVLAALQLPASSDYFSVEDYNYTKKGGYGISIKNNPTTGEQYEARWAKNSAVGPQGLYYRAIVRHENLANTVAPYVTQVEREVPMGAERDAMAAIIASAKARSADVESFVGALVSSLQTRDSDVKLLLGQKPTPELLVNKEVEILQEAGYSAHIVNGVMLNKSMRNAKIVRRLHVMDGEKWLTFDAVSGAKTVDDEFFPWWYGNKDIAEVVGGNHVKTKISVERFDKDALEAAGAYAQSKAPHLLTFSIFSLPIETQHVYRVLFMIPLGAFLVVILRNVVGFITFGTFMPVLIALAFRETDLLWGIILFSLLISLGVAVRFYLERLKLLLVPRLSAVLIVVVLLMVMLSVLTHNLGLERGISLALFPMVIITMTIERMSIVWDELGAKAALKQGVGTLAVSSVIYLIVCSENLEHIIFVFPELLLVVLAATILMGRYSGYRLLELKRFSVLTNTQGGGEDK